MTESEVLAKLAAQALGEKKGIDVQILDMRKLKSAPASFFVIASGNVPSHVSALSDHVHEVVKKATGSGALLLGGCLGPWLLVLIPLSTILSLAKYWTAFLFVWVTAQAHV